VGQHLVAGQDALDQRLDRAAGRLHAEQPGLDDLRVVEDQQVAGAQQRGSSRNNWSTGASPRPSSSRDALRSAAGCCAISSAAARSRNRRR
jgi:hypothetical protein